ncbi:hypothetical protein MRX96_016325 [Rhipicephalus microplus]
MSGERRPFWQSLWIVLVSWQSLPELYFLATPFALHAAEAAAPARSVIKIADTEELQAWDAWVWVVTGPEVGLGVEGGAAGQHWR